MHTVARSKMAADLLRGGGEVAVALALVGPGTVGSALLEQLRTQVPLLRARHGIHLQLLGITNSRTMVLDKSLDLDEWQAALLERGTDASLGALTEYLKASPAEHKAVIDCTASGYVPQHYGRWLAQGIHVVTPNKKLNSGPYADYAAVKALQRSHRAHYLYEGTVGAGLPIISTLKTLLDTGDDVGGRVEGVFSGTLSYIFNNLRPGGEPFSAVVAAARRMGYTEPDPRDDLSGTDVTRKVITLARECGSRAELGDVDTESLVPQALRGDDLSPAEFMARLPEFDADVAARLAEADAAGEVLRYVGSYDAESGVCQAGLRRYPKAHPFASLNGTENIVQFTTQRYAAPPLIVRGPGAGPAVTAAGVFGDLVALARYLGAPS